MYTIRYCVQPERDDQAEICLASPEAFLVVAVHNS